jgi:hypothetical protein
MILWLVTAAWAADPCAEPDNVRAERSARVKQLYDEGEEEAADRKAEAVSVLDRDLERVAEMSRIDQKGWLCTTTDKWLAAWVLLRADELSTIQRGRELAIQTMEDHDPRGAWLVAFAHDRVQVVQGRKQTYGSQTHTNNEGQACLVYVDDQATDADRVKYGHPTLEERYRQILDRAGYTKDAATLDRVERRGLSCAPPPPMRKK